MHSVFCTNVHWEVAETVTAALERGSVDSQLEELYNKFEGSRRCKLWFREIMCRYAYPRCEGEVDRRPCRSECERFTAACPGALQPCESFPKTSADGCYSIEE